MSFIEWDESSSLVVGTLIAQIDTGEEGWDKKPKIQLIRVDSLSLEKPSNKFGDQELTKEIVETVLEIISKEKFGGVPIELLELSGTQMQLSRYYLTLDYNTVGGSTLDKAGLKKIADLVEETYKNDKTYALSSNAGMPRISYTSSTWTVDFNSFVKKYGKGIDIAKEFEKLRGYALSKGLGII